MELINKGNYNQRLGHHIIIVALMYSSVMLWIIMRGVDLSVCMNRRGLIYM